MRISPTTWVPCALIALLFFALSDFDQDAGFYDLLRWAVCIGCGWLSWTARQSSASAWSRFRVWILCGMAVVFNPIAPPRFNREQWAALDVLAALMLFVAGFQWTEVVARVSGTWQRWSRAKTLRRKWKWTRLVAEAKKSSCFHDGELNRLIAALSGNGTVWTTWYCEGSWQGVDTSLGWRRIDVARLKMLHGFLACAASSERRSELKRMRKLISKHSLNESKLTEMTKLCAPWARSWMDVNYAKLRDMRGIVIELLEKGVDLSIRG
ncbi:MAG: DUF6804 family protein [Roseimicrobium sp.]